jgi:3-methyladenine DNA glycosylase AlkD
MPSAKDYHLIILQTFSAQKNHDIALQQSRYMKNQFAYLGLKAPVWQSALRNIIAENGVMRGAELVEFINCCFADEHRELQYAAIEMAQRAVKKENQEFISAIEKMITQKSWWDSVDWIASGIAGAYFQRFQEQIIPVTTRWMNSDNMWLQRSAIIFQLKYKQKTDLYLLGNYILLVAESREFFLRKAAGWALRTASAYHPEFVIDFVEKNTQLSGLTKKEALRNVLKKFSA